MLHLIGVGLDDREVTEKGLEAVESVEKVYAEFYTNTETVDLERIEEKTGSEIEKLPRDKVEREDKIIESAKNKDTAFLVSGDPLTATTHYDIKHRAEEKGLEVEVVHAPSIFTSIAETGLNVYKFGRTVTLPKDASPQSVVDYIGKNDKVGLHTLILLDINYEAEKASEKLIDLKEDLADRDAVVLERANDSSQNISAGKLEKFTEKDLGEPPHCIIVVGETSHKEDEFLEAYR
ncbi:MAG: diphthine synthase [Candidatus Nanohalobium sp.]